VKNDKPANKVNPHTGKKDAKFNAKQQGRKKEKLNLEF
jgi:hypothetical protein